MLSSPRSFTVAILIHGSFFVPEGIYISGVLQRNSSIDLSVFFCVTAVAPSTVHTRTITYTATQLHHPLQHITNNHAHPNNLPHTPSPAPLHHHHHPHPCPPRNPSLSAHLQQPHHPHNMRLPPLRSPPLRSQSNLHALQPTLHFPHPPIDLPPPTLDTLPPERSEVVGGCGL